MRTGRRTVVVLGLVAIIASACASTTTSGTSESPGTGPDTPATTPGGSVYVYWDQNEEQDYLVAPDGPPQILIQPWDPNGQMCLVPDNSGRFVTGYNPTNPEQDNPGGLLPYKDPPVGEALWNADGTFSGQTMYVPGDYTLDGMKNRADLPPGSSASAHFNDSGSMTGCTFDAKGNLFAGDIGTAQGDFPPPDNGRVIMWFGPDYSESCIVMGPDAGGVGPHHVDGTGGLRDPGQMQADGSGNVYVAEAGALKADGGAGGARVLRIPAASIPSGPDQCPGNQLSPLLKPTTFIDAAANGQGFALGLARDPTCSCWAVGSVIGDKAVAFYDDNGQPTSRPAVPGSKDYNPFGIAFTPNGDLYFIDIHIQQGADGGYGPATRGGGLFRVMFTGSVPSPAQKLAGGYDFPTSVTVCDGSQQVCPVPTGSPTAAASVTLPPGQPGGPPVSAGE